MQRRKEDRNFELRFVLFDPELNQLKISQNYVHSFIQNILICILNITQLKMPIASMVQEGDATMIHTAS